MEDYKQRMIEEYQQTKARYQKLHKMLVKHDAGTLDFTPTCPIGLLRDQQSTMGHYLNILEIRAEIEGVDLDDVNTLRGIAREEVEVALKEHGVSY